jgi:electron transport complex protein RnfE
MAPGGFIIFGCLIALVNKIKKKRPKQGEDAGCAHCASAELCGGAAPEKGGHHHGL